MDTKKAKWFVSGLAALKGYPTKKEAVANAKPDDHIHRACECGCGEPAAKPVRR